MQRFLIAHSKGKLSNEPQILKWEDLSPQSKTKVTILEKMIGVWHIYYPDLYPQTTQTPKEKYYIGQAILSIGRDNLTGKFNCLFDYRKRFRIAR